MCPGPLTPLILIIPQALDIHSRHGLITEVTFHTDASQLGSVVGEELDMWHDASTNAPVLQCRLAIWVSRLRTNTCWSGSGGFRRKGSHTPTPLPISALGVLVLFRKVSTV